MRNNCILLACVYLISCASISCLGGTQNGLSLPARTAAAVMDENSAGVMLPTVPQSASDAGGGVTSEIVLILLRGMLDSVPPHGPIYSLDWSPGGSLIAATGYGHVKVWPTGKEDGVPDTLVMEGFVWGVEWSPDGSYLAAASDAGIVRVWDTASWQVHQDYSVPGAFCLSWSGPGDRLAVGTKSGCVHFYDISKGVESTTTDVSGFVVSVDWSPEGTRLAVGELSGKVEILNVETMTITRVFSTNSSRRNDANGVVWSPDGTRVASAHQDGILRVWDVESGLLSLALSRHNGWARGVDWSPDGSMIAGTGSDRIVCIWDAVSGDLLSMAREHRLPVWSVRWSGDGRFLATGDGRYDNSAQESEVLIWEVIFK